MYVAQLFREMLANNTYESFRVSALDTKSKIRELIVQTREVLRERVPMIALDPCLDELKVTLIGDYAVKKIADKEALYFISHIYKSKKTRERNSQHRKISKIIAR